MKTIETKRLILRDYHLELLKDYCKLKAEPLVWQYSSQEATKDVEKVKGDLSELCTKDYAFHALFLKDSMTYIGEAGIIHVNEQNKRCVLGYNLLPEFWGKGYATEIGQALIHFAFYELGIERMEALVILENIASSHVLEKIGFKQEGILRRFAYIHGTFHDVCYYGLIKSDLPSNIS